MNSPTPTVDAQLPINIKIVLFGLVVVVQPLVPGLSQAEANGSL